MFRRPIFGEIISRHGLKPDPRKLNVLTEMPSEQKYTMKILDFLLEHSNMTEKFSSLGGSQT